MPKHRIGPERIVVVGAGLAGARTCEHLRRGGFLGRLTLIGAEPHAPYDRPPLSKEVLREERDTTELPVDLGGLGVEVLLGTEATALDVAERVVHTRSGGRLGFDAVAVATGARPIILPGPGRQFTVRTIEDAHRLRERLRSGARVAIVGAGWIGAEVATTALARGCVVTCVEGAATPVARALGGQVGARLIPWWGDVELRTNTPVDRIEDGAVVLGDGTELPADVIVTGIGARPDVAWLAGSGLELDRGVVTDEWLRAAPGVVAVGDIAAWWSRRYQTRMRTEHWDDAAVGPATAAATLLAGMAPEPPPEAPIHDPVPYFWSDQFGHKLQYVGHHDPTATPIWREPADGKGWSAAWLDASGRLAAVLAADRPRELLSARRAISLGVVPDPAKLADPTVAFTDT